MSGPFGSQQWMYRTGFYPHEIDQSLRFESGDSAYLSRTFASAGNRQTWTWSGWVKRANIGTTDIFFAGIEDDSNRLVTGFNTDNDITVVDVTSGSGTTYLQSNAQFRDPSAWYHFVITLDTTESTASDRLKIYVNGTELTSYSTDNRSSITLNGNEHINKNISHTIGTNRATGITYYNGYLAEVNFVDGQALDPTSFGETKSGVWIPKSYSGSYGTNGFYLDFGNSASLGADSSGNSNNFTPTNLAATDQVLDSPTNNFATLNALSDVSDIVLSQGNLKATQSVDTWPTVRGTVGASSGKWYYEVATTDASRWGAGWGTTEFINGNTYSSTAADSILAYSSDPLTVIDFLTSRSINGSPAFTASDILQVAIDIDAGKFWLGINNTWVNDSGGTSGDPANGSNELETFTAGTTMYPSFISNRSNLTVNFGQDSSFAGNKTAQGNTDANGIGDFYYEPPSGFLALCTANLPDPAIDPARDDVPADYFNTVLYTGNGTGQSITGVGFQPDWVWIKSRSDVDNNIVQDAIRGATRQLFTNLTDAETNYTNGVTSFDSDGFTVATSNWSNENGQTRVAWNWKADGSGVSNTDGSITSTVSVNTDAGFSIVAYTGTGVAATVGHGLSSAPDMYIVKNRDESTNADWAIWHKDFSNGGDGYLYLNGNNAEQSGTFFWNSTVPSSTVISLGNQNRTNDSSNNYIAYCFHSVEGYSKFGGYTGNGDADGPFVYTGFRPAFVMIKRTNTAAEWYVYDNKRSDFNLTDKVLRPNASDAEAVSGNNPIDIVSNGFKLRGSGGTSNGSGDTYIYMAFAEMPFKYSNAR